MKAWLLEESDEYRWGEVGAPSPAEGQVRLAVRASALNHMDLWLTRRKPRPPSWPHVPGADVAGVVESVGEGVQGWQVGDEVVANPALVPTEALERGYDSVLDARMRILGEHTWGGHGELCVVDAHQLCARPSGRSWVECAAYPIALSSAWRLLRRAGITPGDRVLVTGIGGGVATAAMTLAIHLGAEVIVTSRQQSKRTAALQLGAAGAVDSAGPYPEGIDIVVDSIGPATWDAAIGSLRRGGKMCVCGGTSGPVAELDLPKLFWRQLDIIGASCASQVEFDEVTAMMTDGLDVVVDGVFALGDYPEALDRLAGGAQLGKLVLEHPSAG
ncbi:MAG: zinc-binding dehydrogenase [Actinomycetia bacterium]|nr:zinc-binding dehydrogenase [Actinomycetes bacterium]